MEAIHYRYSPAPSGGKIQDKHLDRLAVVYVRQSTVQQVGRHQESTRLQYSLVDRAVHLGWQPQRVMVIDEDLGQSGASAAGRPGFQRLVAEVGLDHVGIVIGLEMSRLARSCRDWYQLLEICGVFGTLIGDLDGVYDPTNYNDRLLLGLKGTMSEAELHILKQRMLEGKRAKARRGELGMPLARGYFRRPSGEVVKDPDEQAQATIQLVFDLFERYGTIHAVLRHLVNNNIELPQRVRFGLNKGELSWSRPIRVSLSNILRNPIYAGAYVYGRRPTDPRQKKPGRPSTGRTVAKPGEWEVCLKDRLPAYISWQQFEKNLRQLESNTLQGTGPVRNGPSLLSGLIVCGRCGMRMATGYSDNGRALRYACSRKMVDYAEPLCQSLSGKPLDGLATELVLRALEPAALEISLKVAEDLELERNQLHDHWQQRLERSRYTAQRAFRQYNAVEPENRLVARSLERQWEEALEEEARIKEEYARFISSQPQPLSAEERESIRRLAEDLPALWHAPETTSSERQAIVRQMIEKVVVKVEGDSEQVAVEFHWVGGHQTKTTLIRPVARLEQLSYYRELLNRVAELHAQKHTPGRIAEILNEEGWRAAKRRETFNAHMVGTMLSRQGLRGSTLKRPLDGIARKPGEWTIEELAQKLDMPTVTLYFWIRKGLVEARKVQVSSRSFWLIQADEDDLVRLRNLRNQPKRWSKHVLVD